MFYVTHEPVVQRKENYEFIKVDLISLLFTQSKLTEEWDTLIILPIKTNVLDRRNVVVSTLSPKFDHLAKFSENIISQKSIKKCQVKMFG